MTVFNSWYYSFSPNVARDLMTHHDERSALKYALYPLMGILYASYSSYLLVSPVNGEAGAVVAGMIAAALLGLVYLAPIVSVASRVVRRFGWSMRIPQAHAVAYVAVSMLLVAAAYLMNSTLVLGLATANLLLSALTLGTVLGAATLTRLRLGSATFNKTALLRTVRRINKPSSY
jgi:hypothetical protein